MCHNLRLTLVFLTAPGGAAARTRGSVARSDELFDTYNAAYVQALFDDYLQNPASVSEGWRRYFGERARSSGLLGAQDAPVTTTAPGTTSAATLRAARAAGELVDAYRLHGHRGARLDPLGSTPPGHPQLDPAFHGTSEDELAQIEADFIEDLAPPGTSMREAMHRLRETYTGTIGYEFEFMEDPQHREWLRARIESGADRQPLSASEQRRLLERLTEVEALEQFIHRSYLGTKRFSIEGTDMLVPMLDLAIERAAANGAGEVVVGMAHRGRLNVLAHILGMPYEEILEKFEGRTASLAGTGDVKYHLGAEGKYATRSGDPLTVLLAPNPSHLEFVDPVVEGMTRAKQTDRSGVELVRDESSVVPILIHGDAAFSGQGVVPETLNLARLPGYRTGGTLHIIANNQVGFTTNPSEGRSTDYASDLARGFDVPIFHVNADDPEACLTAIRLAMAFREHYHADVVIDLIGYRRYGHNEGDEPAYTQPTMYGIIGDHPTVRQLWAHRLEAVGTLVAAEVEAIWNAAYDRLVKAQTEVKEELDGAPDDPPPEAEPQTLEAPIETTVPHERLVGLNRDLHHWPEDFTPSAKLGRQLERRASAVPEGGMLDWAHAEALAYASLLADGVPIRLTGQDAERGTFSQRHLVLHDAGTGRRYTPMRNLADARAAFEVHNSPLSELAAMGFEYGYSVVAPKAMVLWEAQFGDFVNGAQVIVDQFMAAGRAKWRQESRLVLLLPHGYEGQGPEHSSARFERFLQLAAEDNLRVANPSTPAQYFHLLRRQALLDEKRPLIVMTPKSLLRLPKAVSPVADLSEGGFRFLLDDRTVEPGDVRRLVLCSGKVYYDLAAARERAGAGHVALVRLEQLYPFPFEEMHELLQRYEQAREVAWVQEEPGNMGAWTFVSPRLAGLMEYPSIPRYIGRPDRASPAEGYTADHLKEQARITDSAVAPVAEPATTAATGRVRGQRGG